MTALLMVTVEAKALEISTSHSLFPGITLDGVR